MIIKAVVVLTILTYAINFCLYYFFKKEKKQRSLMERFSIFFGTNMSMFFADGIVLCIVQMIEVGVLVLE